MDDAMSDVSNELTDSFSAQYVRCGDWNDFGDVRGCGVRLQLTMRAFAPNYLGLMTLFKRG